MKSDSLNFYSTLRYDDEVSIYYSSKGKNDDVYYILKPDFDLKKQNLFIWDVYQLMF